MLRLDSGQRIGPLCDALNRYPETAIVITGHPDTPDTGDHARKLAERRALSLQQFLIDAGVDASRIDVLRHDDDAPNDNADGDAGWIEVRISARPTSAATG